MSVLTKVTQYTVSCFPDESVDNFGWDITVAYAGHERWAVRYLSQCLSIHGQWVYEHIPSERTDEWLAEHRFEDVNAALKMARDLAPTVRVNGLTAADVIAGRGRS